MNNDFKKGIEELKSINLSESEKTEMFSSLSRYTGMNSPKISAGASRSPFFSSLFSLRNAYTFACVLLIFSTTSLAYAAEGALPGEGLYAIKVNFNEPLRGAFAISSSAKAQWESKKFERRLEEAEKLASTGELNEVTILEVEKRIDFHVEKHDALRIKEKKNEVKRAENIVLPTRIKPEEDDSIKIKIEEHKAILEDIKIDKNDVEREKIERLERKLDEKSKNRNNSDSEGEKPDRGKNKDNK